MDPYCSELQYRVANPVTSHVQSAEQHNQDVSSLGLISARKMAEIIDILKLMSSTFMVALCQAVDLRHLEENMLDGLKQAVQQAVKKTLMLIRTACFCYLDFVRKTFSRYWRHPSFHIRRRCYQQDLPLMTKLREVLVHHTMENSKLDENCTVFRKKANFEQEVIAQL
ncbi:hypothetical protein R1sor_004778 [Riccia sorocarpa]|uniref:Phenylalanine ammonia-lyase n=1 Tax=Riccia sorocarpa TaxID=122646 RepID=A0ABD3HHX7_9MARC